MKNNVIHVILSPQSDIHCYWHMALGTLSKWFPPMGALRNNKQVCDLWSPLWGFGTWLHPTSTKTFLHTPWWQEMTERVFLSDLRCQWGVWVQKNDNLGLWKMTSISVLLRSSFVCLWPIKIIKCNVNTQKFPVLFKLFQSESDGIFTCWKVRTGMLVSKKMYLALAYLG